MTLERTYTVPLRKEYQKAPKYRRAKKAVNALRAFMQRHMKCENILIGPRLNMKIWERGMKSPPHHVKVNAFKDEKEDVVRVELFGFEFKPKEKKEKKEKAAGLAGKIQEKLAPKGEEAPKEAVATKKDIKEKKPTAEHKPAEQNAEEKKEEKKTAAPKAEKKTPENKE
jgi:large subunit ribosomal protein L31e